MGIELRGVKKAFAGRTVVDGIDLSVPDGAFTVLLGPSGCGKTTSLRMIAGLENADAGDILIAGRSVIGRTPRERGVAMVFQDYGLYPHMSVIENVAFPLKIEGAGREERRARSLAMLDRLQIAGLASGRPGRISGGEKQRVSLARALVRKPAVLLMDEPLSNLDALLRVQMRTEIRTLHQELGTTTLYVTHDQVEAMALGTAIAVMREGRIEQYGTPTEIYHRPETRFVARFVGTPSMNFLRGALDGVDGKPGVVVHGARIALASDAGILASAGEVTVGIRSEHLELEPRENPAGLVGTVKFVEPLGQDHYVHVTIGGDDVVVRVPYDRKIAVGGRVSLLPDRGLVHLFDVRTERRIN